MGVFEDSRREVSTVAEEGTFENNVLGNCV